MLFELIASYERRSMLVTANEPFGEWGKVFPDPAMTLAARAPGREAVERKRGPDRPTSYATPTDISAD